MSSKGELYRQAKELSIVFDKAYNKLTIKEIEAKISEQVTSTVPENGDDDKRDSGNESMSDNAVAREMGGMDEPSSSTFQEMPSTDRSTPPWKP